MCVCVCAMRGYNDEPVQTKLGMVIEGPKAEVTEGSWRPVAHVAHTMRSTSTARVTLIGTTKSMRTQHIDS